MHTNVPVFICLCSYPTRLIGALPSEGGGHTFESCRVRHLLRHSFVKWGLITTSPLQRYDILTFGPRAPPRASRLAQATTTDCRSLRREGCRPIA